MFNLNIHHSTDSTDSVQYFLYFLPRVWSVPVPPWPGSVCVSGDNSVMMVDKTQAVIITLDCVSRV